MEKDIERRLVRAVRCEGGWAIKLASSGTAGLPDRLVLFPEGIAGFIELKAPGCKPSPLQMAQISRLKRLGFPVIVLDDSEQIGQTIDVLRHAA